MRPDKWNHTKVQKVTGKITMSIYFSFDLKPKNKRFRKKTHIDFDALSQSVSDIEKSDDLKVEKNAGGVRLEFCPEGILQLDFRPDEDLVKGTCATHLAGPGFHAAAVNYLIKLAEERELKLTIEDETGYAKHKNFEKMRREHFYPWLKYMLGLASENVSRPGFKMCWDIDEYVPEVIPDTVVTPIRRFTGSEIAEFLKRDPEEFATEFFVWNNEKRDALLYRNSALMMMSTKCHFMFSDRSLRDGLENVYCLLALEKALGMDFRLPFPKKEYRLLCRLHEQEPQSLEGVPELPHDCVIGYRRGNIYLTAGQFTYPMYGRCLHRVDRETNSLYFYDEEPGRWHNIDITSLYSPQENVTFDQTLFERRDVLGVLNFQAGDGRGRIAEMHPVALPDSPEGVYFEMSAQIILDRQMLLVTHRFCRQEERSEVIEWFRSFEGKRRGR